MCYHKCTSHWDSDIPTLSRLIRFWTSRLKVSGSPFSCLHLRLWLGSSIFQRKTTSSCKKFTSSKKQLKVAVILKRSPMEIFTDTALCRNMYWYWEAVLNNRFSIVLWLANAFDQVKSAISCKAMQSLAVAFYFFSRKSRTLRKTWSGWLYLLYKFEQLNFLRWAQKLCRADLWIPQTGIFDLRQRLI